MLAGAVSGAGLGLALGMTAAVAAGYVPPLVFGVVLIALGLGEVLGRPAPLTRIGRETPVAWREKSPMMWAVLTGSLLGAGIPTRIGFGLWYALPVGALIIGDVTVSIIAFSLYGGLRTGLSMV